MARELDRDRNRGRVNIWNKETERSTPSDQSRPPPLPPPPIRSRPYNIRQQSSHPISCDEALRRLWQRGSQETYTRERNPFRDSDFDRSTDRAPPRYSVNWAEDEDNVTYGRPAWQQVVIAAPVQEKRKDKTPAKPSRKEQPPPPAPPRLDIPPDARALKTEYRQVGEYDEEPRLRAELYPLEDEPARRGGDYRQPSDTIEILPERNPMTLKTSEFNIFYPKRTEPKRPEEERRRSIPRVDVYGYAQRRVKDEYEGDSTVKNWGDRDYGEGEERTTEFTDSETPRDRAMTRDTTEMTEATTTNESNRNYETDDRKKGKDKKKGKKDKKPDKKPLLATDELRDRQEKMEDDAKHRNKKNNKAENEEEKHSRRSLAGLAQAKRSSAENRLKRDKRNESYISQGSKRSATKKDRLIEGDAAFDHVARSLDRAIKSNGEFRERKSGQDIVRPSWSGRKSQYNALEEDDIPVEKRESVILPVLEENERVFHDLVASGDVAAVRTFLEEHPGFNINCVNYQKISALHVAVHAQDEAMIEFLLEQQMVDCSDCALHAIKEGNVRIVEKIMDKLRDTSPELEFAAAKHSVDFPDDMTPIILAAQLGNYEIIDFLIKRDHIIPPVHNPYCRCDTCKDDLKKYDRLKYSRMKLNLYKAISNPMYIFQVTDDPFQRAFDLTQELMDAAKVFPQFKISYEELWRELRNFTVDLIGCCRNAQEVEIILKKSANNVAGNVTFPRLQYAIDLKQKEFVSHPYTQAVLVDAWTGDLLEWKVRSPLMQALSVFPRIPMLPIMAIMCMILPNHSLVRKWKTPVNKMISSVASYLIFLIILFLESNLDKSNQKRGPPNSGLEGLIIIYVIGYIWLNIRLCFRLGPKRFFSTMWHWFDCIMLFLFTLTIIFWIASLADITANNEVDLPRKYWNALDPELIAEGFFAAAVIMAFFRLNMFLSLNYHLGPLQVSIGKMTLDIFRFIVIFSIIILAWCAGLCRFYQPYSGMVQKDDASGSTTTQISSFVNFAMTLKTFFWAIFGMSPIESADVIIENLPGDTPGVTIINHHEFTEAVGYIAFALFQFLSVVVVLNMLVACMANTFTKVIDNVTVEWVYGRSQIYLSFMAASTLPPPFNLLPTASGIKSALTWLKLMGKPSNGQRAKCNLTHCCYIESEMEPYVESEFPALMSELVQRYLRLKEEGPEGQGELEELKTEMREVLRKMDEVLAITRKEENS